MELIALPILFAAFSWWRGRQHGLVAVPVGIFTIWLCAHGLGVEDWYIALKLGICFAIWRSTEIGGRGESQTPRSLVDYMYTTLRHSIAYVFLWALWSVWGATVFSIWLFVSAALGLAAVRSYYRYGKNMDIGPWIETAQGAALGAALIWPVWQVIHAQAALPN